jgi:hypothetical protein
MTVAEPAGRVALYFAPREDHPLWQAGCAWLGRDARRQARLTPWAREAVSAPWRYGFHATLAAPMALRNPASAADFNAALTRLAGGITRFAMPDLEVAALGDFLALRPRHALADCHALRALADACVHFADDWRAAPDHAELSRRLRGDLDERQRRHVERHGYAHVLEDWRFHMTLSNSFGPPQQLASPAAQALRQAAQDHFNAALAVPLVCEDICLFEEPAPGRALVLARRVALATR